MTTITREQAIERGMVQCPDCERWCEPGLHYCTAHLAFMTLTRKQPSDEDFRAELAAALRVIADLWVCVPPKYRPAKTIAEALEKYRTKEAPDADA